MTLAIAGNSASGYNLTKSLRFRSSASAYLNRTPASSGSQTTFTWSGWVKRGTLGVRQAIFSSGASNVNGVDIYFTSSDTLTFEEYNGTNYFNRTSAVYRDPSAWYHIVVAVDSTQATSSDRVKMYVNGSQITAFSTAGYPTQNFAYQINTASYPARISNGTLYASEYLDGYQAEVNFIDGQQLPASSFGSTNALTGVWQPAKYTGTYGTNGFYLPFTNTTSTTTLGYDFSGNSNNWTTNNLSLTTGSTYDSMTDVPTLTSATTANYCTWNPLENTGTLSNGNLTTSSSTSSSAYATMWIPSGKFYFENTIITKPSGANTYIGTTRSALYVYNSNGNFFNNGSYIAYGATYTTNDVIGCAIDTVNGTMEFFKNGTSQGQKTGLSFGSEVQFTVAATTGASTGSVSSNFGQQPWQYTPPTGFVALNTYNLPTSTIVKGNTVMDVNTYTGNGTGQSIVNSGAMKPDFVWIKSRSAAYNHGLVDTVRGINKHLYSNLTNAEGTCTAGKGITSINSNGFTLGTESDTAAPMNENGVTFVGWQWQAGQGTNTTNTSGSITSTVSVNASAGFSVVTWTGTGSAGTIGHGLGVAPSVIITKKRTGATGYAWNSYWKALGNTQNIQLNNTDAAGTETIWNNTSPTSSVFSVNVTGINNSGYTWVAYCWAEIAGFSKFGSYTGNGSADGTFVYTGFRSRYVMVKRTDSANAWVIYDTARDTSNVEDLILLANDSGAESSSSNTMDIISNGFKLRSSEGATNGSGGTYIYMAFAENPLKYALAR